MHKVALDALGRELLDRARSASSGHAAQTIVGGHEMVLRQTVVAMIKDSALAEHESPGEATLHVVHGRVRLSTPETSWEVRTGDLLVIPTTRHDVVALEDSTLLLTVAKDRS